MPFFFGRPSMTRFSTPLPCVFPRVCRELLSASASGSGNRSNPLQNGDNSPPPTPDGRQKKEPRKKGSFVRIKGLEPPRRKASDPKSDVATNYTTAALESCAKVMLFYKLANICVVFLAKPYFFSVSDKRWVIAASIIVSLPFSISSWVIETLYVGSIPNSVCCLFTSSMGDAEKTPPRPWGNGE